MILRRLKRMTVEDWGIGILNYTFLTLIGLLCTVPFLYVLSISLTSDLALGEFGVRLWPAVWSLEAYDYIIKRGTMIFRAYGSSIFVTVCGTLLGLVVTGGMAYALSKKKLPARNAFLGYVLFSMLFGGGLIPWYLVINNWLNMEDSYFALILPACFGPWNMILMKNFFQTMPESMEESALIDGANEIRIFASIILPLSKPIFATIALFLAVGYWNDWFSSFLFIRDMKKYPIMMVLKNVLTTASNSGLGSPGEVPPSEALRMAVVVVCITPILCIYPFLQKHFAKGILMGSIKG